MTALRRRLFPYLLLPLFSLQAIHAWPQPSLYHDPLNTSITTPHSTTVSPLVAQNTNVPSLPTPYRVPGSYLASNTVAAYGILENLNEYGIASSFAGVVTRDMTSDIVVLLRVNHNIGDDHRPRVGSTHPPTIEGIRVRDISTMLIVLHLYPRMEVVQIWIMVPTLVGLLLDRARYTSLLLFLNAEFPTAGQDGESIQIMEYNSFRTSPAKVYTFALRTDDPELLISYYEESTINQDQ